jgi:NAD(P)H-dependent nitrite reductase small subunit
VGRIAERGQHRPADPPRTVHLPVLQPGRAVDARRRGRFVRLAALRDVPREGGIAIKYGDAQIALFHLRGTLYATQNACPHSHAMVLARGIVGDDHGTPKVACPLHKKTFDLVSGACLTNDAPPIAVFPIRIEDGDVWVELGAAEALAG